MSTKPHRLIITKLSWADTVAEIVTPDGFRVPLGRYEVAPSTSATGGTVQTFSPYFKTRDAAIAAAKEWMAEKAPGQDLLLRGKPVDRG